MSYSLKITVYNNRDYEQPFTLQDESEVALDLTGHSLAFGYGTDNKTLAVHTSGQASNKCITITDATAGQFKLTLPYAILKTLTPGNYVHDLILIDPDGHRIGVWTGTMTIKKGVA